MLLKALWIFTISGNLHLNLTSPEYSSEVMKKIEPFIYDWVADQKGSISAEHGLGFKKKDFIYHSKSKSAVRLMKDIKRTFDPNMILNPYKVLPDLWRAGQNVINRKEKLELFYICCDVWFFFLVFIIRNEYIVWYHTSSLYFQY